MLNMQNNDQSSEDGALPSRRRKNKSIGAVMGGIASALDMDEGKAETPVILRNNDVDDGVIAFGLWLTSQEGEKESHTQAQVPISVKEFVLDRLVVLYDRIMQRDISVAFTDGVPSYKECSDSTDCAHVGFAICVEKIHRRTAL